MERELLPLREAAVYLSVSYDSIRGWIKKGFLPAVRVGRRVLVSKSLLDTRISQGEVVPRHTKHESAETVNA